MAFNVLGDSLKNTHRPLHHLAGDPRSISDYLNDSSAKPDFISPMDDLAFDMYQVISIFTLIILWDIEDCTKS